jgi:hypothetical protein
MPFGCIADNFTGAPELVCDTLQRNFDDGLVQLARKEYTQAPQ